MLTNPNKFSFFPVTGDGWVSNVIQCWGIWFEFTYFDLLLTPSSKDFTVTNETKNVFFMYFAFDGSTLNRKSWNRALKRIQHVFQMFLLLHQPVTKNQKPKTKILCFGCCYCRNLKISQQRNFVLFGFLVTGWCNERNKRK